LKAITLEELSRIQADYKIPKDVRAEKEIEDLAFDTMEWEGWKRPECLMPDPERDGGYVMAIVTGTGKESVSYTHCICEAHWDPEYDWILPNDPLDKFIIERWAYYPEMPKAIKDDVKRLTAEEGLS